MGEAGAGPQCCTWLAEADDDRVFVSVISFAKIRRGIELMIARRRRERLAQWLAEELPLRLEDRILAVDRRVADIWGVVMARSEKNGHATGSMDAFVAATAQAHDLTLVTRNIRDFEHAGISLVDPWQPRAST
jgi:predicted nucleic acid-binding protein